MEISYILVSILQSIAVGLGVGCSTVAITQFFAAISDGKIDEGERRVMGVVYIILRVAMVLILLSTLVQAGLLYSVIGDNYIAPFSAGIWLIILVLFANAVAMTKHWIPSTFGPGIQAGSWYSLGIMFALVPVGLTGFSYMQLILGYLGMLVLAVAIVNFVMDYLKK